MHKRLLRWCLFGVIGVLGLLLWLRGREPQWTDVVYAQPRQIIELVVASGRLKPVRQSNLGPELSGIVETVAVDRGDKVEASQVLVVLQRLDAVEELEYARRVKETAAALLEQARRGALPSELGRASAQIEQTKALLHKAELDYQRTKGLADRGAVARADLDRDQSALRGAQAAKTAAEESLKVLQAQPRVEDVAVAEARLREAEASVAVAEGEVARREIRAPMAGLIVRRDVEPGQSVTPGTSLVTLADMSNTELYVETDENNLAKLRTGQRAKVVAPSYRDQPFEAELVQIGPDVDNARGVVGLKFKPLSLPEYARPDMTVDVSVEVAHLDNVLSVPISSLMEHDGVPQVCTIEGGVARHVPVKVLGRSPDHAAIEGVTSSTAIVLNGTEVKEGQRVRPRAGGGANV